MWGRVLISRPDQSGTFAELAPTLLMNEADLPATQLIQPGSRVSYRALFAGDRSRIETFKAWLAAHKKPGERVHDITDASPQIRTAVERAGRFPEPREPGECVCYVPSQSQCQPAASFTVTWTPWRC